ncbi:Nuclease SbcCD subunit C [compost metagenome]
MPNCVSWRGATASSAAAACSAYWYWIPRWATSCVQCTSSTLRIESLFIDEGFGSLDPESLQLAMDALDGLQAQGRKVAVISHVQEMHERIPVQIQVRRQGNGLSTVEVSG